MIKISTTKDVQLLATLNQEVQELHHDLYPKDFKPFNQSGIEAAFNNIIAKNNTFAFVAKHGEEAVAYMVCMLIERDESAFQYAKKYLLIDQICVISSFRRMGIAKKLLQQATELAKEKNVKEVRTEVWKHNNDSAHFFELNGFNSSKYILVKSFS